MKPSQIIQQHIKISIQIVAANRLCAKRRKTVHHIQIPLTDALVKRAVCFFLPPPMPSVATFLVFGFSQQLIYVDVKLML